MNKDISKIKEILDDNALLDGEELAKVRIAEKLSTLIQESNEEAVRGLVDWFENEGTDCYHFDKAEISGSGEVMLSNEEFVKGLRIQIKQYLEGGKKIETKKEYLGGMVDDGEPQDPSDYMGD